MATTLKIITTDFGADCDDQKAVSGLVALLNLDDARAVSVLIESLRREEALAFVVSGPHPRLAAQAIGEKYHARTGSYPLITLGKQFEDDKKSDKEIFSLTDGQPMFSKKTAVPVLSQEAFQEAIDAEIKSGTLLKMEQIVLAPLHGVLEYYNPHREALLTDCVFQTNLAKIEKTATLQFQRADDGLCKGNNYQKSAPGIADGFLAHLQEQGFETLFFDGAVAKLPEFLMNVTQEKLPGLQKSAESYMAAMQVPWLYMTEAIGVTPSSQKMHAGMFTAGASFPFGVHVAAGTPAGFGAERALKEICGITKNEPEKFAAAFQPIEAELDRFDHAVLQSLQIKYPAILSVDQMRAEMHRAMMAALQSFAEKKGVVKADEKITSFTELFKIAKEKSVNINPYNYMQEFTLEIYAQSPVTQEITAIAATESGRASNGLSHTQILSGALAAHGARAIIYDAVAVSAADTVRKNKALKIYFGEKTASGATIINITAAKVEQLKEKDQPLYAAFAEGIRQSLTIDGAILAQGKAPLHNPKAPKISPS